MITQARTTRLLLMTQLALASALTQGLSPHGFVLHHTQDEQQCLAALATYPADLLLVSGTAGLVLCRYLRTQGQDLGIILLVEQDNVASRVEALDAGASDLVTLPIHLPELLLKIRSQLQRPRAINPQLLQFMDVQLNLQTRVCGRGERRIDLTTKEFDLLCFLLEHPQQTLSREQILLGVWGADFAGESNIIEVYIRYLRLKLEHDQEKKLIQTVRGIGYALRE
ncbi:response regulator transcription factor [Candidatus Cyanaurora vandensis]|uniref:response regulator transcription factor n=1 Tax=Candidatus Cyanaurora vandensis TaxID=2714958 RepID=UPI00257A14AA|nr:response regulator transcription factor [Candidatus Cyanaurora vandensis]